MKDTEYLFPQFQVTFDEVKACEGKTRCEASAHLGIPKSTFDKTIRLNKLGHLFHTRTSPGYFMPEKRITVQMARDCKGMTIGEAADHLGVSFSGFETAAHKSKIIHLFTDQRPYPKKQVRSAPIERSSETGFAIDLVLVDVPCRKPGCKKTSRVMVWPGGKPSKYQHCADHKQQEPSYYDH